MMPKSHEATTMDYDVEIYWNDGDVTVYPAVAGGYAGAIDRARAASTRPVVSFAAVVAGGGEVVRFVCGEVEVAP